MPIITQCPKCGKKLKAPDEQAGRQAKCPQCKKPFIVQPVSSAAVAAGASGSTAARRPQPAAKAAQPTPQPAAPHPKPQSVIVQQPADTGKWFVQAADGNEYGPVSKRELDQWVTAERIDSECQILQEGWNQWKWAEDVYPQLAAGGQPAADNPFAGIGDSASAAADSPFAAVGESNPYASPQVASSSTATGGDGDGAVTQKIIRYMDGTRPWVMFFAVLAFLVTGLTALVCLGGLILLIKVPVAGLIILVVYGTMGGIYGFLGVLLLRYTKAMGALTRARDVAHLEKAIEAQRNFWKFVGILTIVMMGLMTLFYLMMFLGAVSSGISASSF